MHAIDRPAANGASDEHAVPGRSTDRDVTFHTATARGPWGPIRVATDARAVLGIAVLAPTELFVADVARRTGRTHARGSSALLDRTVAAVEAFVAGRANELACLPLDLADRGDWDRAVLGAVHGLARGEVSSYGRIARVIGRKGAARAVGGAVGRNPIGLAIPCHRVLAGDGSVGGYGGDWFGTREQLLVIKRELLAREGIALPARFPPDRPA